MLQIIERHPVVLEVHPISREDNRWDIKGHGHQCQGFHDGVLVVIDD